MTLLEHVASRIRELRTNYGGEGISQEALASAIGIATNTISRWETGTYKPAIDDLDKLARYFGVSILEFFPPDDKPTNDDMVALLHSASDLSPNDLLELRRYAEWRRAEARLKGSKRPIPGRKRKDEN